MSLIVLSCCQCDPDGTFTCTMCNKIHRRYGDLEKHVRQKHKDQIPQQHALVVKVLDGYSPTDQEKRDAGWENDRYVGKNDDLNPPMKSVTSLDSNQVKAIRMAYLALEEEEQMKDWGVSGL